MSLNFNKVTAEQNFEKDNADDDRRGMCLDCFAKIPSPLTRQKVHRILR
jgi:hypothetical protein